jgi:hypothetical protein
MSFFQKYRVICEPGEITIITEQGNVAFVQRRPAEGVKSTAVSNYYFRSLKDAPPIDQDDKTLNEYQCPFEWLSEGKTAEKYWQVQRYNSDRLIRDALNLFSNDKQQVWVEDDDLFTDYFPKVDPFAWTNYEPEHYGRS